MGILCWTLAALLNPLATIKLRRIGQYCNHLFSNTADYLHGSSDEAVLHASHVFDTMDTVGGKKQVARSVSSFFLRT